MSKSSRIINGFFPAFLVSLSAGLTGQANTADAQPVTCATPESDPVVEIVRQGDFAGLDSDAYARENYVDYIGTISNANFHRFWDGTCGSYKVPVRIVAPKAAACDDGRLAHVGLIELMHPNEIGGLDENGAPVFPPGAFAGVIHGWNDPVYDSLLDQGSMEAWLNIRAPFLFGDPDHGGGGVIYMGFQANNYEGTLDYIAALPANSGVGLHLERPQDYAILYRDVSKWLRQAKTTQNFVNVDGNAFCSVSDVIGFGYSFTSMRLKAVLSNPHRLNSTWGSSDPVFSRGRVMDGVLLAGLFGQPGHSSFWRGFASAVCPDVTGDAAGEVACSGPDAASEGPMVVVRSEGDVQGFLNRGLRPGPSGRIEELEHFKVHEISSTSHLDGAYFPMGPYLEYFGVDSSLTRQNPLDRGPVLRADLINLLDNIRTNAPIPSSRFMEAQAPNSRSGLGIVRLDPSTGNGFGGVALPQAAAPLGIYRGLDCHGFFSGFFNPDLFDSSNAYHYALPPSGSADLNTGRANYVLETIPALPFRVCEIAGSIEGLFTPYSVVDEELGSDFCGALYPTRQAYTNKVTAAADQLIAERLLLPEERDEIIAAAEAEADKHPECVPAP